MFGREESLGDMRLRLAFDVVVGVRDGLGILFGRDGFGEVLPVGFSVLLRSEVLDVFLHGIDLRELLDREGLSVLVYGWGLHELLSRRRRFRVLPFRRRRVLSVLLRIRLGLRDRLGRGESSTCPSIMLQHDFPRMTDYVLVEQIPGDELLLANIASERLFSRVAYHVLAQEVLVDEALVAESADEGLLSGVRAQVAQEADLVEEGLLAHVAGKWLFVSWGLDSRHPVDVPRHKVHSGMSARVKSQALVRRNVQVQP